jgi:hypothetical protein
MKIRSIDAYQDWSWGLGKQDYKDNEKALEQDIITKIRSYKNDCFFDLDAGIDWDNLLGGKNSEIMELKKNISNIILGTDGVIKINSFELSLDSKTRQLNMNISINTIYGNTEIKG